MNISGIWSVWSTVETDITLAHQLFQAGKLWMGKEKRLGSFAPWASLVVQSVKNLPAKQETWLDPWVGKSPLEKEMVTHSSILAWRIPMD